MRKNSRASSLLYIIWITVCTLFILFSCSKDEHSNIQTYTYTIVKPVYKPRNAVYAEINGNPAQAIEHAGKIYIKDNYIFLNDVDKGIHVIDNSDPSRPVQTAFLNIPGCQDIAVKGNILYADMFGDLLAIDITNPRNVHVTKELVNFFSGRSQGYYIDSNQVIIDWIKKDTTVSIDMTITNCNGCVYELANNGRAKASPSGVAGSMAGMVLINNYLYAITEMHSLGVVDLTNAAAPALASSSIFAGFDLQTIYPFEDKLFLGSAIGMFMYDISDPAHPAALGQFSHGRACDPVVTDGNYAYVTLHAGTECGGESNELNVVNVQDLMNPKLVKTYPMTKPTGLCKDGNLLFVCDGSDGVKLYDATNASDLKLLQQIASNEPFDVIAMNGKAVVVTEDGLFQYDYNDINHIRLLSFFSAKK